MAIQKRFNRKKDLSRVPIFIEETGANSKYFQIYDVPNELPMGKSSFLIAGSDILKGAVKLQIELIDSKGGVIYTQPVFGYSEGVSKRIAVEVYEDTPPGRASLVVLGEINPSKVDFQIPSEFKGVYNVRYTRDLSVNLTIPNTLPIRFYRTPKSTVAAISKGVIELDVKPTDTVALTGTGTPKSHVGVEIPVINTDGSITYPGIDARTKNIRAVIEQNKAAAKAGGGGGALPLPSTQQASPGDYTLTLSSTAKAEVGMIGQNILVTSPSVDYTTSPYDVASNESYLYNVPSAFSSSVLDVPDENTLTLLDSFYMTKKGEEPPTKVPVAMEVASITATRQVEPTGSESTFNFFDVADILLTDLRNFSGDINKVKVYTRSDAAQNPSQWNFIKEIFLEAKEELYDTGSLLRSGNMGYFITQERIDDYWQGYSGEFGGTSGGAISLTRDNSKIMNSMDVSGSNRPYNNDLMVQSKNPMHLLKNVRYEVSMKIYGDAKPKLKTQGNELYEGKLQIFISGSGIPANTDLPGNFGRLLGSIGLPSDQSNDEGSFNFELVEAGYFSRIETNAFIQVRMPSGRWKLAEISVKPATSTNFSPEVFKCYAELPVAQKRPDFYQFLIEFYDVDNNKADTVALSERIKFEGANLVIEGAGSQGNLLSGSMFIGGSLLSGIEAGGGNSAFIRSLGYFGFDKAESLASGGFMIWSGSVVPQHETYDGVGLELHNDETSDSGNDSYLQFRTKDPNGNSLFRVKTDEFFFGNAGQHISGSGGNIQISSSKFFLGSELQYISGSDGNIEISSSNFHLTNEGDVLMSGTVTATAGYIAGWQIVGNKLSGSNVTLDAAGSALYKSDTPPDAFPTTGYYIDFTPGTNYYVRFGPHFAVSSSGILIASGAQIEGQLTASSGLIANWNIGSDAIYKYTTSNTWTGMSSTGPTRFFAGSTTLAASGSAPFNVKESGEITASSGLIGGWSLSANKLVTPNSRITMSANPGNERITVRKSTGSAADTNFEMVRIGEISDAAGDLYGIKVYDGTGVYNDATKQGQVVLLGEQGNMIGGWEITDTQIRSIPDAGFGGKYYEGESGLIIHSSGRLESADFATNLKGWRIDSLGNGTAEFENCRIRGTLSTAVFEKESVNVVGGQLMVSNASALGALKSGSIIIAGAETASATAVTMSMDNVSGFAKGEIIKAKVVGSTGFSVEYMQVTGSMRFSHPSSSVSASLAGYDLGAIDPDGLAGEIYVGRSVGAIIAVSSSVSTITEPMTQSSISGSTELITVASTASFSNQDIIKIDDERMKIISLKTPTTMVIHRDYNDTDNMAHADNSAIYVIDSDKEFLAGLVSTAQPYNAGQVFVSTGRFDSGSRGTGYILMNANPADYSTPYIDIVERTGSGVYDLSLKTRIGDLSGLSSAYLYGDEEPGFGIYTENGFFSGAITAQTGSFAGIVHVATVQGGLETGEKISIGRQVSGENDGFFINNNNYWYTTGAWKVGGGTNFISLDNATDGNITIASQTFNLDATDLDISSTNKKISIGHDAGNGSIILQGGSTSYMELGSSNKLTLKTDATDQFMCFGSKTSFTHFDQSTAGLIMGMDSTVPKFEFVGTSGEYISFDGANLVMNGSITITGGSGAGNKTFRQDEPPTAIAAGDIWYDSNDGNKVYRATGAGTGNWVDSEDTGIAAAQGTANTAETNAQTGISNAATAQSVGQAAAAATETSASNDATSKVNTGVSASLSFAADRRFNDELGKLDKAPAPAAAGLYMGSTYLGYFDSSNWKTYMANTGDFFLQGATANRGLAWDASANLLSISGSITALDGYIGGESQGWSINSGYITSVGGTKKVTLDGQNAKIFIGTGTYDNSNTPVYMDGASQFSLGDKLTWDGSSLSLEGSVTITSGPLSSPGDLASKTNLAGATVSASNAQSAATSAGQASAVATEASASTDATNKANTAQSAATSAGQASAAATELSASANTSTQVSQSLAFQADRTMNNEYGGLTTNATPSGTGLFIGADYLGYYASSTWKTYMANNGDFFLQGTTPTKGLTWDSSANQLSISGSILSTDGYIGGWGIVPGFLYGLDSGTPTSSPSDGIVLASSSSGSLTVYENTQKRVQLGYLSSGVYGLRGYDDNGSTVTFEMSDAGQSIAGWDFTDSTLSTTDISLDSTNKKIILGGDTNKNQITIDAEDTFSLPSLTMYSAGLITGGSQAELIKMSPTASLKGIVNSHEISGSYTEGVDKVAHFYPSGGADPGDSDTLFDSYTGCDFDYIYVDESDDINPPFAGQGVLSGKTVELGSTGWHPGSGSADFDIGYDGVTTDVTINDIVIGLYNAVDTTECVRFNRVDVYVSAAGYSTSIVDTITNVYKSGTEYNLGPISFSTSARKFKLYMYFYQCTMSTEGTAGSSQDWQVRIGQHSDGSDAKPSISFHSYMGKSYITRKGMQTFAGPLNQVFLGGNNKITGDITITKKMAVVDQLLVGRSLSATGTSNTLQPSAGGPDLYVRQSNPSDGIWCSGNVTAYSSDVRLKENILPIESAVHKALQIRGVEFDWKDETVDLGFYPRHKHEPGLIAQEVEKVVPEAVIPAPFNQKYKTIDYNKLIPLLFGSIHELNSRIEDLETKIVELKNVKNI